MDLKQAYRNLDPSQPLGLDSEFYVERGRSPIPQVAIGLELGSQPQGVLITGHRGTGKTTELRRLGHAAIGRSVVPVSIAPDVAHPDSPDKVLTNAVFRALAVEWSEHDPDGWLESPSTQRKKERVQALAGSTPTLVLVDDADKLEDGAVEPVLRDLIQLISWGLTVVCTVPLSATQTSGFMTLAQSLGTWHFLPPLDVRGSGRQVARQVLERRAPDAFGDDALELIIDHSAGIHREILQIAQRACAFAAVDQAARVDSEHVRRALHDLRGQYSLGIRSSDLPLLERVQATGRISGDPEMLRLVRSQLVVAQGEDALRFEVHPLIRPMLNDNEADASRSAS